MKIIMTIFYWTNLLSLILHSAIFIIAPGYLPLFLVALSAVAFTLCSEWFELENAR